MPSQAIKQVRGAAKLLQLHAPLLPGCLNPVEQTRPTAESIELHAALLDSIADGALSPIERARLSAELLQIRADFAGEELSPVEMDSASAREDYILAQLGRPVTLSAGEGQAAFEAARTFYQERLKGRVIQSVIGPVQIRGASWKKAKMGMKADPLKAKLIEYVREILETGAAGQRQEPHKERNEGFVAFYFIQKQVKVNDLLVTAGVTVAEDDHGNLFYNVSHSEQESWKAKKNGGPDYAGVVPRSGAAVDGVLDSLTEAEELSAAGDTVAEDEINITILAVVRNVRSEPEKSPDSANAALLDAAPELAPKSYNALDVMRFSAELLAVRANLENGKLGPLEQMRASARGLELRGLLGGPIRRQQRRRQSDRPPRRLITEKIAQKNGGVLVVGDADALDSYAKTYLDQAKYTKTPTGLLLTKSQARLAQHLPDTKETLPYGAVIYSYADIGGVAVAVDRELSGIARDLPELKSLMAQQWGPEKYRSVFGEDAAADDVQAYQDKQDAITRRKADNAAAEIEKVAAPLREKEASDAQAKVQAEELAATLALQEHFKREEFEKTIGAGISENPIYQAYLDTLEELPTSGSNAGFLGWAGIRAGEFTRLTKSPVSANKDDYLAYVRKWADEHLAERVATVRAGNEQGPLVITAETPDTTIEGASDEQLQAKLLAVAKDFYRGLSHATKDVARRLEKGAYARSEAIKALKQNRDYLIERVQAGAASDADILARMARQYGDKSVAELIAIHEGMGGKIRSAQSDREMNDGGRRTGPAVANEGARQMGQHRLELGIYIKARQEAVPAPVEPPAPKQIITGTGTQFISPGVLSEPPEVGAIPVYGSRREFLVVQDGQMVMDESKRAAIVHAYGKTGPATVRAHAREYNTGRRWILNGETIVPTDADQDPEPPAAQHEIIEYTTKRNKVLRGIVRTDLALAEAKAIDPYTWRMNGGYFIREQYLDGDTAHIQASPSPVVLSPEQEIEKAANAERLTEERRQKALGVQVEKLRTVANKAVESGAAGMAQDRLSNTARRAGMAASSIAKASANKADGQTLNNIADAIEVGAGGLLTKLSSRAQLEELQRALRLAQYETDRRLSYSEQLARKGRPFDDNDLKNITMPSQVTWASRYRDAAKAVGKHSPTGNMRLMAALNKIGARSEQFTMNTEDAAITRKASAVLKGTRDSHVLLDPMESIARLDRLARMGITDATTLREAARELLPMMVAKAEESAVKKAERAIIGQKVGIDFFPTPASVAQRMARLAGITQGTRVLEPSAGNGNLADAAKAAGGEVDVIEISSQLRDILTAKGYTVVDHDFDGFTPEQPYQAIIMNPPFSARKDASHIMRAFGMLGSGGRLVAIAGEGVFFGADQKAVAFRAWLDTHKATIEKLEGGTFKDKDLLAQTGANGRLIVIKK
ncbi:hypothetical protein WG29040_23465 [Pseudomonas sp. PAMC 29040]|uniref:LPD3 domain-containing protein n=1 Tax=Pseudomonas sp. PAMC 29040 TaxID=2498450 RepID=UPI000FB1561D|nr:hypothetical protein [Pseudomonas sp. PAMC 29040]RUT30900.1 hypothetical protein WG29040_23465 [Pseudomonas sp. PAMC 29040]